jgi:hypothetical protein
MRPREPPIAMPTMAPSLRSFSSLLSVSSRRGSGMVATAGEISGVGVPSAEQRMADSEHSGSVSVLRGLRALSCL